MFMVLDLCSWLWIPDLFSSDREFEYAELLHEFMSAVKQNYGEKVLIQFIREYTVKVDELIKDKIEATNEMKAKESEENDVIKQQLKIDGDFLYFLADATVIAFQYGTPDRLCSTLIEAKNAREDLVVTQVVVLWEFEDFETSF